MKKLIVSLIIITLFIYSQPIHAGFFDWINLLFNKKPVNIQKELYTPTQKSEYSICKPKIITKEIIKEIPVEIEKVITKTINNPKLQKTINKLTSEKTELKQKYINLASTYNELNKEYTTLNQTLSTINAEQIITGIEQLKQEKKQALSLVKQLQQKLKVYDNISKLTKNKIELQKFEAEFIQKAIQRDKALSDLDQQITEIYQKIERTKKQFMNQRMMTATLNRITTEELYPLLNNRDTLFQTPILIYYPSQNIYLQMKPNNFEGYIIYDSYSSIYFQLLPNGSGSYTMYLY